MFHIFFVFVSCLFNICFMFVSYLNAIPILLDMEINMLLLLGSWFHVSYRASDLTLYVSPMFAYFCQLCWFFWRKIFLRRLHLTLFIVLCSAQLCRMKCTVVHWKFLAQCIECTSSMCVLCHCIVISVSVSTYLQICIMYLLYSKIFFSYLVFSVFVICIKPERSAIWL